MSFIEEYRALEAADKDFDHGYSSFDFSTLSDDDLREASKMRLMPWSVKGKIGQEQMDRASRHKEERRKENERLKARYGYYFSKRTGGEKDEFTATDLIRAETYEEVIVELSFEKLDEAAARRKIHEMIPTITDAEIDEYKKAATSNSSLTDST